MRPDLDTMRRTKAAFEILKAPCFRTCAIIPRGCKYGLNLWQEHHHKAKDAPRGASKGKREFTSTWDRWQNDETYRKSQLVHGWSDAWVRYLDQIAQIDISHKAPHEQRERYKKTKIYRGFVENDRHHLHHKDQGIKMQRMHWLICKRNQDKTWEFHLSQ